jgi:steroid 5-alpha reductase family enzyme
MNYILQIAPDLLGYLLISVGFNLILFIPAFIFKTDKLTDMSYSLTFILLAILAFFSRADRNIWELVMLVMIVVWAIRLGGYLLYRVIKLGKDARFDDRRDSFVRFGLFWLLQGLTVWIVMIPAILFFISNAPVANNEIKIVLLVIGLLVWLEGLVVETLADIQKFNYIEKAKKEGRERHWVDVGLWSMSRHPNYLGEITVWLGVYVVVITRVTLSASILALVGPVFIFLLIRYISGVPMLEKKADERYAGNPEYEEYKNNTGLIIPFI